MHRFEARGGGGGEKRRLLRHRAHPIHSTLRPDHLAPLTNRPFTQQGSVTAHPGHNSRRQQHPRRSQPPSDRAAALGLSLGERCALRPRPPARHRARAARPAARHRHPLASPPQPQRLKSPSRRFHPPAFAREPTALPDASWQEGRRGRAAAGPAFPRQCPPEAPAPALQTREGGALPLTTGERRSGCASPSRTGDSCSGCG